MEHPTTMQPSAELLPRRHSVALRLAVAIGVVLVYVGLEWATFIHVHKGVPITPWNPGLGMIFGFMLFVGPAAGALLFAGTILAEFLLQTDLGWPVVLGMGLITTVSYAGISLLVRRALHFDVRFTRLRDVLLLLVAGLAGALTSAVLLTALLVTWGPLASEDVSHAALPLLVGDVIGIVIVTPLLLRFVFHHQVVPLPRLVALLPELFFYGCLIMSALLMVGATGAAGHTWFYLLFVPVVAAALRRGLDGACLSLAATQFGLVEILHLHAYDARVFTQFQVLMLVLTATGLIVGAVVNERRHADRQAREAEARLKQKELEARQAARFNLVTGMASALAHEITQPMTAARALARSAQHLLQTPGGDLARAEGNLATLVAQIDHAGDVLRHVRDFLRRGTPHLSTIDVRVMLDEAMILIRSEAIARRVKIELEVADDLPALHGDHVQLEQVLLNLVRNAMEAIGQERNGRIQIGAHRLDDPLRVEFSIVDNGPGVPADMADRLFNPLTTSKHDGLGLGLSICDSIIKSHQGQIWLQSGEPGRTEFRFLIPVNPPAQAAHDNI
jgi:two-component system, LuxR family, sensor kinase FixL